MKARASAATYAHLAIAFCRCMKHPGALLHRLSQRHRHAETLGGPATSPGWFEAYIGRALADVRPAATTCRGSAGS